MTYESILHYDKRNIGMTRIRVITLSNFFIRYINTLLEEILDDTVKHVAEAEKNGVRHSEVPWQGTGDFTKKSRLESKEEISIKVNGCESLIGIDSPVSGKKQQRWSAKSQGKKQFAKVPMNEGYVNPAFVGSTDRLASLDLDRATERDGKRLIFIKVQNMKPSLLQDRGYYISIRLFSQVKYHYVSSDKSNCFMGMILLLKKKK